MMELVTTTKALLAGDPVSYRGEFFTLIDAALQSPRRCRIRLRSSLEATERSCFDSPRVRTRPMRSEVRQTGPTPTAPSPQT